MRLRLPFAYEHDRYDRYHRRATKQNFWSFVEVEIPEVPDLGQRIAISGKIDPYHSWNGRLYQRWHYVGGGPLAEEVAQTWIDGLMNDEPDPDPARFPALPHMRTARFCFKNAIDLECDRRDDPGYHPLTRCNFDIRAEEARAFYPNTLVMSEGWLWVEAEEPVLDVRVSDERGRRLIGNVCPPNFWLAGYQFRLDRREQAREFIEGELRERYLELEPDVEFDPAVLRRNDWHQVAICMLASAGRRLERSNALAGMHWGDPRRVEIGMKEAWERVNWILLRGRRLDPRMTTAIKRWLFEHGQECRRRFA